MGLLDFSGFVGDDTAKDEYGLTQADRRQPLWSGLFKAGMLGMAAGQDITQGQRANLMAQMGGAVGGIPEAMNQQKAEAAQMQLKRQQFTAGQQKLEQAAKLRAYAATPEYAELIKDAPPHIKAGLKFAIEAGDADSVQRLLTGIDTTAARARGLDIREADLARKQAADETKPVTAGVHTANFLKGQKDSEYRKSPEYALAWDYLQKPHISKDPTTGAEVTVPGLVLEGKYPPPIRAGQEPPKPGDPPKPSDAPATPTQQRPEDLVKTLPDGGKVTMDNGTVVERSGDWTTITDQAGNITRLGPNGRRETLPAPLVDKAPTEKVQGIFAANLKQLDTIDSVVSDLENKPNLMVGGMIHGNKPTVLLDEQDPDGVSARANLANLRSQIVHDRSGAAVSIGEMAILKPFLPNATDNKETIKIKLRELKKALDNETKLYYQSMGRGVKAPPAVETRYGASSAAAPAGGEKKWKIGDKWTDAAGRKWIVDPDGNWKTDQ